MLSTHQFLIILQHFTIIYALDVLGEQKLPPQNVFLMCELFKVKKLRNQKIQEVFLFQFSSVTQSYTTLCDPKNHSTPGLPVHHHLPELAQTRVH